MIKHHCSSGGINGIVHAATCDCWRHQHLIEVDAVVLSRPAMMHTISGRTGTGLQVIAIRPTLINDTTITVVL